MIYTHESGQSENRQPRPAGARQAIASSSFSYLEASDRTRWSPDNGRHICFASNATGRQNLWIVDSNGGWPLQLTVSDQRQIPGGWSPDGKWIVYQSDYDGNEQWDLFVVSTVTGEVRNLTDTPRISEESPRWSPDGKRLAYTWKPKTAPSYEIHVMEFPAGRVRRITTDTPKEFSNQDPVWSPDGRSLAFTRTRADGKRPTLCSGNRTTCALAACAA